LLVDRADDPEPFLPERSAQEIFFAQGEFLLGELGVAAIDLDELTEAGTPIPRLMNAPRSGRPRAR
jgi:hypothetical protein